MRPSPYWRQVAMRCVTVAKWRSRLSRQGQAFLQHLKLMWRCARRNPCSVAEQAGEAESRLGIRRKLRTAADDARRQFPTVRRTPPPWLGAWRVWLPTLLLLR